MKMGDFKYEFNIEGKEITARPFCEEDFDSIIRFAKSITMNENNYETYLGIGHEAQFPKTGALLETCESELREIMEDHSKFFSLALWTKENEVLGLLTLQLEDVDGLLENRNDFNFKEGLEHKWQDWLEDKVQGTLAYKGDLAIKQLKSKEHIQKILLYVMMKELTARHIKGVITEVFHITECHDKNGIHKLDVYNKRSLLAQVHGSGARYICDSSSKTKDITKEISVKYFAKILEYDFEELFPKSVKDMEILNIGIKEVA